MAGAEGGDEDSTSQEATGIGTSRCYAAVQASLVVRAVLPEACGGFKGFDGAGDEILCSVVTGAGTAFDAAGSVGAHGPGCGIQASPLFCKEAAREPTPEPVTRSEAAAEEELALSGLLEGGFVDLVFVSAPLRPVHVSTGGPLFDAPSAASEDMVDSFRGQPWNC